MKSRFLVLFLAMTAQTFAGVAYADGLLDRALDAGAKGEHVNRGDIGAGVLRNSDSDPSLNVGMKVDALKRETDEEGNFKRGGTALGVDVNYTLNFNNGASQRYAAGDQDSLDRAHMSVYYDPFVRFAEQGGGLEDGARVHFVSLGAQLDENKVIDAKSSAAKLGLFKMFGNYELFCAYVLPSMLFGKHEIHQKDMKTFAFEYDMGACLHDKDKRAIVSAGQRIGIFSDHDETNHKAATVTDRYIDVKFKLHSLGKAGIYAGMNVTDERSHEVDTGDYHNRTVMFGVGVGSH